MKIEITRERFLKPLQQVIGAAEQGDRLSIPILGHVHIWAKTDEIVFTTTNLQIEMSVTIRPPTIPFLVRIFETGLITVPAKRLLDILKTLPPESQVTLQTSDDKAVLRCGRSRFSLVTLPAQDFPAIQHDVNDDAPPVPIKITASELKRLIERTRFAVATADVRYYLNGLFFEVKNGSFASVGTDGHRLSYDAITVAEDLPECSAIVPNKAIGELLKSLGTSTEETITLYLTDRHLQAAIGNIRFASKLIDGKFPDYNRVIPCNLEKTATIDRETFRQSVAKVSVVNSKPTDGINLKFDDCKLTLTAKNAAQEDSEDELEISYKGDSTQISFNYQYLLEALTELESALIRLDMNDSSSSVLLTNGDESPCKYVIMPLRI